MRTSIILWTVTWRELFLGRAMTMYFNLIEWKGSYTVPWGIGITFLFGSFPREHLHRGKDQAENRQEDQRWHHGCFLWPLRWWVEKKYENAYLECRLFFLEGHWLQHPWRQPASLTREADDWVTRNQYVGSLKSPMIWMRLRSRILETFHIRRVNKEALFRKCKKFEKGGRFRESAKLLSNVRQRSRWRGNRTSSESLTRGFNSSSRVISHTALLAA